MPSHDLPEAILQFGSGRFLRAFADVFIDQANRDGQANGRVVVVQSTGAGRAEGLNRQAGRYHVLVRGLENGAVVDRVQTVESVSRALSASTEWDEVLRIARSPDLRVILSNTTESGYDLDREDHASLVPPRSFPAKLLAVLTQRHAAGQRGLTVIPCELREHNAELLQSIVVKLARDWKLPDDLCRWIQHECTWLNTLVDRIVTGTPKDHPLLATDPMLIVCEPYALWAVQRPTGHEPFLKHPNVVWTPDVQPYFLRKVRILNGAHTALVIKALPRGFATVREAVSDAELGAWLERLLFEEVVPVLEDRVDDAAGFARQTLERFRNPFVEHRLADIATHHAKKVAVRLEPTRAEFRERFGRTPPLLDEVLSLPAPTA
jgi:tagaturonate reductase